MRIDGVRGAIFLLLMAGGLFPTVLNGQSLPDTLTFDRTRELLRAHNPQLRAAGARGKAQGQAARTRALFPNPTLSVSEERTNLEGDGADDQWYLSVTQPLRYPGEHSARTAAARAAARAAEARAQETAAKLYRIARRRYLDVVVAERRHTINRHFAEAIRKGARAAQVRVQEGDLGTFQQARIQTAQAQYEDGLAEAKRALRTARTNLYALLHLDSSQEAPADTAALPEFSVAGTLQYRPVRVSQGAALQRALQRRGQLRAARATFAAHRKRLTTARYGRLPNLSVSAGPKTQSLPGTETTFGFTAALNVELPIWNGGQTNVDAARNRRFEAQARLEAARRQVQTDVRTAIEDLRSYRSRIETVSQGVLADTDSLLQNAQYVYQEGDITLFELLDAIESARAAALLRTRLTAQYLRALHDLEYALGVGPADSPVVIEGALDPQDADLN
ncbi:TolC family protein [Salinibacter altiplanensis]|uniref:TolC family protein n=1 Tax=Salinibacter altiplanensis TaxID=1803181 RepID=UPI001F24F53C|nr:TolC family protein [Salinibacter altiplanensis]